MSGTPTEGDPHAGRPPFFMGWARPPARLLPFLSLTAAALIVVAGIAAYLVSATQADPGTGAFAGTARVTGVMQASPYPVIHVTESDRFAPGTPLLLSGGGKIGVQEIAEPLDGQVVEAGGAVLERGELFGLQIGSPDNLSAAEAPPPDMTSEPLGRWRLTGEICDGKCLIGAMRPGRGLAHRACANICISGGVPPVFVATDTVEGSEFFLLGSPDGGPLAPDMLDYTAILIDAEGRLERYGELNIFYPDPETVSIRR